jgi:phospholipase/carboxylesterase
MEPMVARWGTQHPAAPLVVALHGNGTSEHSLIEISPWLPHGPVAYASVRGRIQRDKGWSWWDGDDPDSLDETVAWLLEWLDTEGDPDRPVLLLGFREGVTAAGALMLSAPHRFSGAVLLYGAFPLDPPPPRGHLAGMPVFLAHGTDDPRTPPAELERTWQWLTASSGAPVWAERGPGGAQLAGEVVGHVTTWLADRLDHLRTHGENPLPDGDEPAWDGRRLPLRAGDPPLVSTGIPQFQLGDDGGGTVDTLWARLTGLGGVSTAPTTVGPDGSRSLLVDRTRATGPDRAFLLPEAGEFAHQHPGGDLHAVLPDELAYDALAKGWAVAHPLAGLRVSPGTVLVPAPRDAAELEVVAMIARASHRYATGDAPSARVVPPSRPSV